MSSTTFSLDEGFQDAYKASSEESGATVHGPVGRAEYQDPMAGFFGEARLARVLDAQYDRIYRLEFARETVRRVVDTVRGVFGGDGQPA